MVLLWNFSQKLEPFLNASLIIDQASVLLTKRTDLQLGQVGAICQKHTCWIHLCTIVSNFKDLSASILKVDT
mgnify:CR=1 FL=1